MSRFFKILSRAVIILILLVGVLFGLLCYYISPLAKKQIEKNCVQWTGRRITLDEVKINLLNGTVNIKDLKICELDTNQVFLRCHNIYIKVNLMKMLYKVYQVDEIKIDNPEISIIQDHNKFNFDDLIKRFSPDTNNHPPAKTEPETKYFVTKVSINNGNVLYNNVPVHNIINVHNINLNTYAIAWNNPESKVHLDLQYGIGGFFDFDLDANRKTLDYNLALLIDKYDLSQYYAPLNAFINISSFQGMLSTKLKMKGKFNNPKDFSLTGYLHINDLEIKDSAKKKVCSFNELLISVDTINVKRGQYIFRKIMLDEPYVVLNDYTNGNNISRMIKNGEPQKAEVAVVKDTMKSKSKADYSNIFTLLSSSAKAMTSDFLSANYHADTIAIRNGQFVFNDNTSSHKFHYNVSKINMSTTEIGAKNKSIIFTASALMNDTGKFALQATINYDLKHKAVDYKITALSISKISPIVKYVLEKNSEKWIGRQMTIGGVHLDALNGIVKVRDIKVYEANSNQTFFDCHYIYLKANMKKMFSGTYGFDTIKIDQPEVSIIQDGNKFNYDDLIKRFSTDTNKRQEPDSTPEIHYVIDNVIIDNGNITYNNVPIHNIFRLHNLNINLPEISWNEFQSKVHTDFKYGRGGDFNIDMNFNRKKFNYDVALQIDKYDLSQYYTPLTTYLNVSSLKGFLSANLEIHGKFSSPKDISSVGSISVNDFELKDSAKEKVFALGELNVDIDTVNVKQGIYSVNNILLDKPYMRFDYFTNGNNISHMIKYTAPAGPVTDKTTGEVKPDYSNVFTLFASSIKMMAVDFFNTNYHTDSILIRNGQLIFNDYTLNRPFHYDLSQVNLITDEISAKSKTIAFNASARLNDTGKFTMNASMGVDLKNMLISYNVSNLRISDLNPYSEYYVATPFLDGYMNYQSTDSVINRNLKSTNVIHIWGLEAGKKTANKPVYDMPIRLAVSLLKDDKGNIDLNLPASGNLDDPNYKMGKLIWPMISDLVKKTAESPFRLLGKLYDKDPEEMKQLNFDYLQDKLSEKQAHKLEDIHKVLNRKKELNVEITQVIDSLEEKDELALAMAKKQYYQETKHMVNDSLLSRRKKRKEMKASDKIATQDTLFDKYLNEKLQLTGNELMTIEDKCIQFVGDDFLNKSVHEIMEKRNQQIMEYLIKKKSLNPERVKVSLSKDSVLNKNSTQPQYNINYNAGDSLKK